MLEGLISSKRYLSQYRGIRKLYNPLNDFAVTQIAATIKRPPICLLSVVFEIINYLVYKQYTDKLMMYLTIDLVPFPNKIQRS